MLLTTSLGVDLAVLLVIAVIAVYKYLTRHFDYWKKRGVFHLKPTPFFGNLNETFKLKMTLAEQLKCIYETTDEPYVGIYVVDTPVLLIRSPKLAEHILVKDFKYFKNRSLAAPKHNPIVANYMGFQDYEGWRKIRPKMSPLFSNSKLKGMFCTAQSIIQDMELYLSKNSGIIEAKQFSSRFTTEVVTRCYFGINGKCFKEDNSTIFNISRRSFDFSIRNAFIHLMYILKPALVDVFKLDFMRLSDQNYLIAALMEAIDARKANKTTDGKALDYIDIILEILAREGPDSSQLGMIEIPANAIQFFLAATETMSGLQSFCLYELAIHPEVQDKLRKEVLEVQATNGGINFEALSKMEYLECCMLETMRKYVSLQTLDRKASEDYTIPGTDLVIEKGIIVYIPVYAIQNDKKYYSNPDGFIPERFQNAHLNTDGLNYLPFGAGPRICLGERFGMIMSKYMVAAIIASYELEPCDTTPIPIKLEPKAFTFQSSTGLPVRFKPIKL